MEQNTIGGHFKNFQNSLRIVNRQIAIMQQSSNAGITADLKTLYRAIDRVNLGVQGLPPQIIKIVERNNYLMARTIGTQLAEIHERIQFLSHEVSIKDKFLNELIPAEFYPEIEKVVSIVEPVFPQQTSADLVESITVRNREDSSNEQLWTWESLRWFLALVASLISAFYIAQQGAEQLERHHHERTDQLERHHREQMDQTERHHKESITIQKEEAGVLHNFMEFIESRLPPDQAIPEIDPVVPEPLE